MSNPAETVTIEAVCGNCALWRVVDMGGPVEIGAPKRGNCYALPPTPIAIFGEQAKRKVVGQINLRAATTDNDTCGMFVPRADLLQPGEPA